MEHELWAAALLNQFLPGVATWIQSLAGVKVEDPSHPWANWAAMEIVVTLIILVLFPVLRARLSVDRPGRFQQTFELVYEFLRDQADENHVVRFLPYFGTVFIFVLFSNLLGIIPSLESPTMYAVVPCGVAVCTFLVYHIAGVREHGLGKYLLHFVGPFPWLAPLMIPIELISHCARPLSLTVRLYGNMFAGEQVTLAFIGLTYLVFPAASMALHVFVSFLQAYIFALLSMIYISSAVAHED